MSDKTGPDEDNLEPDQPRSEIPPEFGRIHEVGRGFVAPPVSRFDKHDIEREDPDSLADLDPGNIRDHIELEVSVGVDDDG